MSNANKACFVYLELKYDIGQDLIETILLKTAKNQIDNIRENLNKNFFLLLQKVLA